MVDIIATKLGSTSVLPVIGNVALSRHTLLLALDWVFAFRALGRQVTVLAALIFFGRVFHRLRRIGRSVGRNVLSFLDIGMARQRLELIRARRTCQNYKQFKALGEQIDSIDGLDRWKQDPKSKLYDHNLLESRIEKYGNMREQDDLEGCMFALRGELLRKHFGICNPALFEKTQSGTKTLVEKYIKTVCQMMAWVAFSHRETAPLDPMHRRDCSLSKNVSVANKLAFFTETKHSFGRSALLLSGGASLGMYHFGVIKALHLNGLLPRIIAGTSAGSIIAGAVCTRTNAELEMLWEDKVRWEDHFNLTFFVGFSVRHFISSGGKACFKGDAFATALKQNIGEYTFMEAYDRTGRICNITVSGIKGSTRYPMLLNYLTAPHVLIWSAAVASCALPGIFEPQSLLAKERDGTVKPYMSEGLKWQDGSMQSDLPMSRLAELFNVNFFIVSQVNPQARICSGLGVGSHGGVLFAVAQFLRGLIRQHLISLSGILLRKGGARISPWLRPIGFSPVALIVQEYTGDVTIFNGPGFHGMHTLLRNATPKTMKDFTNESQRETWWHIPLIKSSCMIEFVMDEIINELRAELLDEQENSLGTSRRNSLGECPNWTLLARKEASGSMKKTPSFIRPEHAVDQLQRLTSRGSMGSSMNIMQLSSNASMPLAASNKSVLDLLSLGNDGGRG